MRRIPRAQAAHPGPFYEPVTFLIIFGKPDLFIFAMSRF